MTTTPYPGTIRTVVAGVDGGEPGWWALAWAADEAAARGAHLVICRVYPPDHLAAPLVGRQSRAAALQLADPPLVRQVDRIRARLGGDRVTLATPSGDPGQQLVDAGGDLLVVGARAGDRRPVWAARGSPLSTARWVAAHARCPVVVVRPLAKAAGLFAGHVVVGVDGSDAAQAALAFGFQYAAEHGVPLAAVHATGTHRDEGPGDVWVDDRFAETHLAPPSPGLALLEAEVEPYALEHPSVPVKRALYQGAPVPALLRAATGARLLIVGDRGRGAVARLLLGSVSQGVLGQANEPVVVAHAGLSR